MANEVDNRVVQLEMDNGSFEQGANQSIKTLGKLDNALNLKNGKRSFSEVEEAAAKCDFKPLIEASKTAIDYMSTLGTVAATVIQNITNRAVNAGIDIAKSLSIDQITTGFSKYEQKTANVQTLVNSTGKSVDEINTYLDRLMWFSDETSYGFTDMTQALSTMVTAGGDIDKLVPMIEGMANATAFAGKGAAEFNRVIYNLNQSYSQGYLNYMDWKSVELAGASSKQLVEELIRAGEEAGTIKKGEVTLDNFTSTLSKKWANREVMEKGFGYFDEMTQKAYEMIGTLDEQGNTIDTASRAYEILSQQYNGVSINAAKAAQEAKSFTEAIDSTKDAVSSGWMRTFEIIFGNYEQAKTLWTDVANGLWDIFAGGFEERNNLLEQVFQHNIVDDYATSLEKAGVKFDDFKAKMKAAYRETGNAADRMSEKDFEEMTAGADNFADLLKQSWVSSSLLEKTIGQFAPNISQATSGTKKFAGNVQDLLKDVNSGKYGYGIEEQQKKLIEAGFDGSSLGSNWLQQWYNTVASGNEEAISAINDTISTTEEATEVLENQTDIFDELATKAKEFDNGYYSQNSGRTIVLDGIKNVLGAIGDRLGMVKKAWDNVFPKMTAEHLKNILITFHSLTEQLKMGAQEGQVIESVATKVFTALSKIRDIFVGIGRVGLSAIKLVGRFGNWLHQIESVRTVIDSIKSFLNELTGGAIDGLGSFADKLSDISTYLDSIDESSFEKIKNFADLVAAALGKVVSFLGTSVTKIKEYLSTVFSGKSIDFANIFGIGAIGGFLSIYFRKLKNKILGSGLTGIAKAIDNVLSPIKYAIKSFADELNSKSLKNVAFSIGLLAASLLVISSIDGNKLVDGLMTISTAAYILYTITKKLSKLNIGNGEENGGFFNNLLNSFRDNSNLASIASAVLKIAFSLLVLSGSIKILSSVDIGGSITALLTLFGVTKILESFMKSTKDLSPISMTSLISIAISMLIFAKAIKSIGQLSLGSAVKGVAAIGIILFEISRFLSSVNEINPGSVLASAVSMLIIGNALVVISVAIAILGLLDVSSIAKGIITIGVLLAIFGFFASAMKKVDTASILSASVAIFAMSSALVLIAAALAIASIASSDSVVGLLTTFVGIVTAFALLNKFGGDSASMLGTAAALIIVSGAILVIAAALTLLATIKNPVNTVLVMLGSLVVLFAVLGLAGLILEPIVPVILALSLALLAIGAATLLAGVGLTILSVGMVSFAASIVANIGLIMSAISLIIDGVGIVLLSLGGVIISVATQLIPDLVNAALILVNALINGFASNIGGIVTGVSNLIVNLLNALSTGVPSIVQAGIEFGLALINGFADGIRNNSSEIFSAFKNILSSLIELAIDAIGELLGLIPGVGPKIEAALGKAKDSVRNFLTAPSDDQLEQSTVASITAAGKGAAEEATIQGQSAGEAFAGAYVKAQNGINTSNPFSYGNSPTSYFQRNPNGMSQTKDEGKENTFSGNGFDVGSLVTSMETQIGATDFSGITSMFGSKLTDGLSQYISGEGMQSILTNITGSMGEGDFSIVTDNISSVFTQDLSTSLSNMENTDAVKESVSEVMDDAVDEGKKVDSTPVGKAFGDGVVQAIKDCKSAVVNAAKELASAAMEAFASNFNPTSVMGVSEMADYEGYAVDDSYVLESAAYTITPVLDMSEVYDGLSEADTLYSPVVRPTLDMSGTDPAYANVSAVARYDSRNANGYEANAESTAAQVGGVTFTQNNYSPKNLSKVDIYRQTRNQLDQYERMIKKR